MVSSYKVFIDMGCAGIENSFAAREGLKSWENRRKQLHAVKLFYVWPTYGLLQSADLCTVLQNQTWF